MSALKEVANDAETVVHRIEELFGVRTVLEAHEPDVVPDLYQVFMSSGIVLTVEIDDVGVVEEAAQEGGFVTVRLQHMLPGMPPITKPARLNAVGIIAIVPAVKAPQQDLSQFVQEPALSEEEIDLILQARANKLGAGATIGGEQATVDDSKAHDVVS